MLAGTRRFDGDDRCQGANEMPICSGGCAGASSVVSDLPLFARGDWDCPDVINPHCCATGTQLVSK